MHEPLSCFLITRIILTNVYELKDAKELAREKQWHLCVYMSIFQLDKWQVFDPVCSILYPSETAESNKYSLNEKELTSFLGDEITFFTL